MKEQEKVFDDMVNLCFEEFGRLRLDFGCHQNSPNRSHFNNKSFNSKPFNTKPFNNKSVKELK